MTKLRRWVQVDDEKKNAAALEKKAKRELAELEPDILEQMAQEGTPKITVELEALDVDAEVRSVLDEFWTNTVETEQVIAELRERGLLIQSRPAITKSVFIGRRVWAKPVATGQDDDGEPKSTEEDWARAVAALEANDFGDYVQTRFNIISLSSAMKEEVEHGNIIIPDGADEVVWNDAIVVSEKPQLNARKVASR